MKAYKGTFKKRKNREMVLHKTLGFTRDVFTKTRSRRRDLKLNALRVRKLVWDLEADSFRVFNWKTIEGKCKHF